MLSSFKGIHIRPNLSDDGKGGSGTDAGDGDELLNLCGFRGSLIEDGCLHLGKMEAQRVIVFQHEAQKITLVF